MAWPGSGEPAVLPEFDGFNRSRRYIDVFNRGTEPLELHAEVNKPWILVSVTRGTVAKEQRLWVRIDWDHAPPGLSTGTVTISGPPAAFVEVQVKAFKPQAALNLPGFIEADGCVVMEATHYTSRRDSPFARWESLPDHGRIGSAMTVFPVTALSANPLVDAAPGVSRSPCLEYTLSLFSTGRVEVVLLLSPSLNYAPDRGMRIGISFDEMPRQLLTVVPKNYVAGDGNRDWEQCVKDSIREVKSVHTISQPGPHTLNVWMVDPGVVLQRLILNTGGVRPSYLGPPESFRFPSQTAMQGQ
jgi:hypothetical protein